MVTALGTNQTLQIQSFWNLIQASDENVQKELFRLLNAKYAPVAGNRRQGRSSFFNLKGILKSQGDAETDNKLLDEYLREKYDI
ncbi:MAG: hypothetical protein IJ155_07320 [Prevotella sp.]|nr:hypothetical protein [Prevotella sp.]